MLKCIFITNNPEIAKYCEQSNVDIILIDTEVNGKYERQKHMDSVKSNHRLEDIPKVKRVLEKAKVMTRINPYYVGTKMEVEKAIQFGTDIIMLPMFKTSEEVKKVSEYINGRVEFIPLLETSQALVRINDILDVKGIKRIHLGLNDLHLSLGLDFMFECLSGGIVEYLTEKIIEKGIEVGIGGISRLGTGKLKADLLLSEHVRLGSNQVILSRSFHQNITEVARLKTEIDLKKEVMKLKNEYLRLALLPNSELEKNKLLLNESMKNIIREDLVNV
ncbi:aldolase/citrate lyase family protein [Bacillus sp. JJ1533]|uniref:aldolase/citrate lyase family protein n=1 Tax=Bacillus sp. JJ1533 TaxID=3122959 RepID=UPI003000370D